MLNKSEDRKYLLYLASKAKVSEGTRVGFSKLVFLADYHYKKRYGEKLFSYKFYNWIYGPYSGNIIGDIISLVGSGFLIETDKGFQVTAEGLEYLKEISNKLDVSKKEVIDQVTGKYYQWSARDIVKEVFKIEVVKNSLIGHLVQ